MTEFTAFDAADGEVVARSPDGDAVRLSATWTERDDDEAGWEPAVRALVAADAFAVTAGDGTVPRSAAAAALADASVVDDREHAAALLDYLLAHGALRERDGGAAGGDGGVGTEDAAGDGDDDGTVLVVLPADPGDWDAGRGHLNWAAATAAVRAPFAAARDHVDAATDDLDPVAAGAVPEPLDAAPGAADAVVESLAGTAGRLADVADALDAREEGFRVKAATDAVFPDDAAAMADQLGEMAMALGADPEDLERGGDDADDE